MTKEHAWPQWLGQGEQVEPTQTTRTIGFGRSADDAMTEAPNRVVIKPGSVLTARIREVCADCNNGWMSRLEEEVRPLLQRLWQPSYPFGVTTFSAREAEIVATWAAKTAWVRERVTDPDSTPTAQMREELMVRQMPPDFTSVWIARHQGQSNFGVYAARIEVTHQDDHWTTSRRRHVLICTMTFRGLSVLVRTDDGWGVPPMRLPAQKWQVFWRAGDTVQWPPDSPASDGDVRAAAAHYAGWLRTPEIPVFNRDPNGWQEIRRN
jgi:hypothetical protein